MSHLSNALRAGTAAALMGSFACLGSATASADPTTGNSADVTTLAASLSKGYNLNNCIPQNVTGSQAGSQLAALTCGPSSDSGGPAQAKYVLFSNPADLSGSFKASIKDDTLTSCGDTGQSPTNWHQGSATASGGTVACGTYQSAAEIIWTIDAKNVMAYVRASNNDVSTLYQWWRTNG
jgi:hypothetical protein